MTIKLASSLDQQTLNRILEGLKPLSEFTISDELIESGFIAYASYEFESVDSQKVYVSIYTRVLQKVVLITCLPMITSNPSDQDIFMYASDSWVELTK